MRIVLDTNVLVSATRMSMPGMAVHMIERRCGLLKSHVIEQQLFGVLDRPYIASLIARTAHTWLANHASRILRSSTIVDDEVSPDEVEQIII
jgi:predicted nucleic acid-binding protein